VNEQRLTTRELVLLALFVSLNIVLARVASIRIAIGPVEGIRLGFGTFPVFFAGVSMGPLAGAIVGALGDLLGYWINPMGPYMPHFTFAAALSGFLPAVVFRMASGRCFWRLFLAVASGQILVSTFLVPWFLQNLFGLPFAALFPGRVIAAMIHIPLYAAGADILLRRVRLFPAPRCG
jgi:ECF transporter S component (folate family)